MSPPLAALLVAGRADDAEDAPALSPGELTLTVVPVWAG